MGKRFLKYFLKMIPNASSTEKNGLVALINGISTFMGYLMPQPYVLKNSSKTNVALAKMRSNLF